MKLTAFVIGTECRSGHHCDSGALLVGLPLPRRLPPGRGVDGLETARLLLDVPGEKLTLEVVDAEDPAFVGRVGGDRRGVAAEVTTVEVHVVLQTV